jgi:trehalose 6-phosphate phosphatase
MTDILALRNQHVLERYASSNLLVGFDYDGTLAPIVSAPDRAQMRPITRRLLTGVAERYPCVVISGRSRDDLVHRLRDIPIVHVSGNHGLEPWAEEPRYIRQAQRWVQLLSPRLAPFRGIVIENKTYSISIHYRAARDKENALRVIDRATRDLHGSRRIGGRMVVNLLPKGAPTKGTALERARRLLACDLALYVGDDETDEDVFGIHGPERLLSVRVGASAESRAKYCLKHQGEIDELLRRLVALRQRVPVDAGHDGSDGLKAVRYR